MRISSSPTDVPRHPATIQDILHPMVEMSNGVRNETESLSCFEMENTKKAFVLCLGAKQSVTHSKDTDTESP